MVPGFPPAVHRRWRNSWKGVFFRGKSAGPSLWAPSSSSGAAVVADRRSIRRRGGRAGGEKWRERTRGGVGVSSKREARTHPRRNEPGGSLAAPRRGASPSREHHNRTNYACVILPCPNRRFEARERPAGGPGILRCAQGDFPTPVADDACDFFPFSSLEPGGTMLKRPALWPHPPSAARRSPPAA